MLSLKTKTIKGTIWSAIDGLANQGVIFIVGLLLARLLSPEEYGLIGYVTILISVLNSFVDSGFSNALIRKTDCKSIDYNTTFYFNLAMSIILFISMYFIAIPFSKFFNEPQLIAIVRAMSCIVILNALAIVQRTDLVKKIDFKTQTKASAISSICSGIIGVLLAYKGFGVWSLVIQQITMQLLRTICFWSLNKWKPKLEYSWNSFKELFGFGSKLLLSGLIDTIWKEISNLVIGKCYSTSTLGQYTRGQQFSNIFSVNMTAVVQRVSYPALSSIQSDKIRLNNAYRKIIRISMLISFVFMFGMIATAKPLIASLIGEKWMEAAEYLQIICFSSCLYPLHAINLNMLQVQGRSDLYLKLEILKKSIAVIPILLGIFFNIKLMLWGNVIVGIISFWLNSIFSGKMIGYSTTSQLKDILPSFSIAAIMAISIFPINYFNFPSIGTLCIQIIVGACMVIFLGEIFKLPEYLELKNIVLNHIK